MMSRKRLTGKNPPSQKVCPSLGSKILLKTFGTNLSCTQKFNTVDMRRDLRIWKLGENEAADITALFPQSVSGESCEQVK